MSGNTATANRNTHWQARQLATMALLTALGVILSFLELPGFFAAAPFLKYDASLVTAMITGLRYGPGAGCVVSAIIAFVHGVFLGDLWGALMNAIVGCAFVLPAAIICRKEQGLGRSIVSLVISAACAIVMAVLMNLLITPIYSGAPLDSIIAMILPILLPFNIIKYVANSILSFIVFKTLGPLLK
jgi:riboflavin transporter FmnP